MTETPNPDALTASAFDYGSTPYEVIYKFLMEDQDDVDSVAVTDCEWNANAIVERLKSAGFEISPKPAAPVPAETDVREALARTLFDVWLGTGDDGWTQQDQQYWRRRADYVLAAGYTTRAAIAAPVPAETTRDQVIDCAMAMWEHGPRVYSWEEASSHEQEWYMGFARKALAAGFTTRAAIAAEIRVTDISTLAEYVGQMILTRAGMREIVSLLVDTIALRVEGKS